MKEIFTTVPNRITAIRFLLIPVLWVCAWQNRPELIGYGMFLSALTDYFDGYFARKLKQFSEFGGRFDAWADNLMLPSALIWLWMFQPDVFMDNAVLCTVGIVLYVSYITVGLIKFRQFANLHLYSSRLAAVLLYLFIPFTLILGDYNPLVFKTTVLLFSASAVECLIVLFVISEFSDHVGSALFLLKRKKTDR